MELRSSTGPRRKIRFQNEMIRPSWSSTYASQAVSLRHRRDFDAFAVVSGLHPAPTSRNKLQQPLVEFEALYISLGCRAKATAGGHLYDVIPVLLP